MNETSTAFQGERALTSPGPRASEWLDWTKVGLFGSVCCLVSLDGINGAMSSTLRPYLMGSLAATPDEVTWTSIAYFAAKLFALLVAARVQERFGQRQALLGASMVLVFGTAGGALVMSYPQSLIVRMLQGASGGLVVALGQGALLGAFPRREQPLVQGVFALAAVMFPATMVPVLLGGYAEGPGWRYAYAWMALFGLVGCAWLFWSRKSLGELTSSAPVPIGRIVLLGSSLFALAYVLQQGNRNAWLESPYIVWPVLLVVACLFGLAFAELHNGPTYLRYGCFRFADFTFGVSVSLLAGIALFGSGFAIPGFTAAILEYPVLQSGLLQLCAAAFATFSLLAVGAVVRFTKVPGFLFVAVGLVLFGSAMWKLGQSPSDIQFDGLVLWLVLRGLAVGCLFLPLTLMTLTSVPTNDGVAAAGFFNFGRQLGGLVGVAWIQTLLVHLVARNQTVFGEALSRLSHNAAVYVQTAQGVLMMRGLEGSQGPAAAMAVMLREAHRQMAGVAFDGCFQSLAMLFVFGLPLVMVTRVLTSRFLQPSTRRRASEECRSSVDSLARGSWASCCFPECNSAARWDRTTAGPRFPPRRPGARRWQGVKRRPSRRTPHGGMPSTTRSSTRSFSAWFARI